MMSNPSARLTATLPSGYVSVLNGKTAGLIEELASSRP